MALIFHGVLIVFTVSSFSKLDCLDFITNDEWPQFTRPQSTVVSGLGGMLESYHKLHPKPKPVPEFINALQLICSALPEKVIDNSVKDHRKRLQACVSAILNI